MYTQNVSQCPSFVSRYNVHLSCPKIFPSHCPLMQKQSKALLSLPCYWYNLAQTQDMRHWTLLFKVCSECTSPRICFALRLPRCLQLSAKDILVQIKCVKTKPQDFLVKSPPLSWTFAHIETCFWLNFVIDYRWGAELPLHSVMFSRIHSRRVVKVYLFPEGLKSKAGRCLWSPVMSLSLGYFWSMTTKHSKHTGQQFLKV